MPDYSFIAQPQTPDSFKTIGSMLGIATGAQQLKTAQQEYQRGGVQLQKEQSLLQPAIEQGKAQSQSAQELAQQQHVATIRSHMANAGSQLLSLYGTGATPDQVAQVITETGKNAGAHPDAIAQSVAGIPQDPALMDKFIVNKLKSALDMSSQLDKTFPAAQMVNTGGQVTPVAAGNPALTGVSPGTQQGTPIANTLSPETKVFDPTTNSYRFLGQPAPAANASKPLQSGPALGQEASATGAANTVQDHWKGVLSDSGTAAQNIGIMQEIKKYAPGAMKGVTSDRRAFVSGLAGLLGMDAGEMAKTDTDLLAKNSSMIALAGGDTNLAKTFAESANPNIHMTEGAIIKAANQVIGQQQLKVARQQYLLPAYQKQDPNLYNQRLAEFNSVSDPRVFQLPNLSAKEVAEMKSAMSPQEQTAFRDKIVRMKQMGILP